MANIQHNSKINDINLSEHIIHSSPIPLMSLNIPSSKYSRTLLSSSCRTSINEPICSSPVLPISIFNDNISSTSTFINQIDISKFYFAHVIKLPHGTNLLASDNQSTTICINTNGNIIHLITPTGYHIRSLRWPKTEKQIIDLLWCEVLQVYLVVTLKSLYTFKYDTNQSLLVEKRFDFSHYNSLLKNIIACNSYRLYIYNQSIKSIDVYTFQFIHLHTKQLPNSIVNNQIEIFSCSNSYLIFNLKDIINKILILDPTTMIIKYEFNLLYNNISSIKCLYDDNTLVFIGMKQNEENRLVFFNFNNENEIQQMIVEKSIDRNEQFVYLLPNCQDLMLLNVNASRVQYLKYRS